MPGAYDYTVEQRGIDTSGRPLLQTHIAWMAWDAVLADPRIASFAHKVTLVQGAFMARLGGGAADSAGYHNEAGAGDVRTWNLTTVELDTLIRVAREHGFDLSRRDATHGGFDPHAHWAAGWDYPLSSGIAFQWSEYQAGRDGLASRGPDYEWRPSPLVLTPITTNPQEDYMATDDAERKLDQALEALGELRDLVVANDADVDAAFKRGWLRDKAAAKKAREVASRQMRTLGGVVDALTEAATETDVTRLQKRLAKVRDEVLAALAADPDVDGPDDPAPVA